MDEGDVRRVLVNWGTSDHEGKSFRILEAHYAVIEGGLTLLIDRVEMVSDSTKEGE